MVVIDVRRRNALPQARCLLPLALAAVLLTAAVQAADPLALETIAEPVPTLALKAAADGATLDLRTLVGKLVLLHFWATWCTPCKAELAALQQLAAQLDPARSAIVLIAIDSNTSATEVLNFAHQLGIELPVYLARDSTVSESFWGWGVPVSYLLDRRGNFIGRMRGARPWTARAVVERLQALTDS